MFIYLNLLIVVFVFFLLVFANCVEFFLKSYYKFCMIGYGPMG